MKRVLLAILAGAVLLTTACSQAQAAGSMAQAQTAAIPPPPVMGWSAYNFTGPNATDAIIRQNAQLVASDGLAAMGYHYIILDGGWNLVTRDSSGNLVPDPAKFPDGIASLAAYVHSLGLRFGLYLSAGTTNCAAHSAGSYGHYTHDAAQLASWGVDFIKFDYCDVPGLVNTENVTLARSLASQMETAIRATGRNMVLDVNDGSNARRHDLDWTWAAAIGAQEWRIAGDIQNNYTVMLRHFTMDAPLYSYAGPGHHNDADYLEVGNGLPAVVDQAEFALWAIEASPLVMGTNLATVSASSLSVMSNTEVIAIDQDTLGAQGHIVSDTGGMYVIAKPMHDGSRAVVCFNTTAATATCTFTAAQIDQPYASQYLVRDVLSHTSLINTSGTFTMTAPSHGVAMVRITSQ